MILKEIECDSGKVKAKRLGLTSTRFSLEGMSQNAQTTINSIKGKDRPELTLQQWSSYQYHKTDATKQLFDCPDDAPRQHINKLSVTDFVERYEKKNRPLLIDGCAQNWNMQQNWTFEYFYQKFKDVKFKVGEDDDGYKLRIPFKYFLEYLVYNKDDSPIYLFEGSLETSEYYKPIIENYKIPPYFKDDLLKYAGQKQRPPYRWILMGPERSGTTIHIDPLGTSAWNTSLVGHKRWVLFPNNIPKFIVKGKAFRDKKYTDEAINYFVEILPKIIQSQGRQRLGIIQFIQHPGETVFVPGGWWHAVINLDDTMAVTQNVMTHNNFDEVWRSLRSQRKKFAEKFLTMLRKPEFGLYERAKMLNKRDNFEMGSKYQKQSVSLSFTPTQSSSSSSSSDSQSDSSKNKSKRSRSETSKNRQRSRNKKRSYSDPKKPRNSAE